MKDEQEKRLMELLPILELSQEVRDNLVEFFGMLNSEGRKKLIDSIDQC